MKLLRVFSFARRLTMRVRLCRDLYRDFTWKPKSYQDYLAPIVANAEGKLRPLAAGFSFWSRAAEGKH